MMAVPFRLKFGSLDLAPYLRVGNDEGFDPYDSGGFEEPAFIDNPFGEGQGLANVDSRNREMSWPLYLNDTGSAVTNVITNPNAQGGATPPTTITGWVPRSFNNVDFQQVTQDGAPAFRLTRDTDGSGAQGIYMGTNPDAAVTPGQYVAVACEMRKAAASASRNGQVTMHGDVTVTLASVSPLVALTDGWQRVVAEATLIPASNTVMEARLNVLAAAEGETFYVRRIIMVIAATAAEADAAIASYGDGDSPGWAWDGAAHASTSSKLGGKDGLHAIVRDINQEIRYAAHPLRVEWRDQDASASTFYDVEFARFDPNFRMRPSAQKWLAGTLRVWTKPFGHTATERVIGTAVGSSHLVPVTIASRAGDIDSQVVVHANMGTSVGGISGYTVLPHPSYSAARNASQIERYVAAVGTVVGASGGVASMFLGLFVTATDSNLQQAGINLVLSPATVYAGRHRVMAVMRSKLGRGFAVNRLDAYGEYTSGYGPTSVGSHSEWHLFDLGVITVPSHLAYATYNTAWLFGGLGSQAITGSPGVQITELLVVPEESTHLITGNAGGGASMTFDGVNSRSVTLHPQFYDRTGYANGYPGVPPGGSYRVAAINAPGANAGNVHAKSLAVTVSTRERFTFAR